MIATLRDPQDCFAWSFVDMTAIDRSIIDTQTTSRSQLHPYTTKNEKIYLEMRCDNRGGGTKTTTKWVNQGSLLLEVTFKRSGHQKEKWKKIRFAATSRI